MNKFIDELADDRAYAEDCADKESQDMLSDTATWAAELVDKPPQAHSSFLEAKLKMYTAARDRRLWDRHKMLLWNEFGLSLWQTN